MSKWAVLSDIHGNYEAFSAVMQEIRGKRPEGILFLGDILGYYYHPRESIELLLEQDIPVVAIRGNHERMLVDARKSIVPWSEIIPKYGHALEMAEFTVPKETLESIIYLPDSREIEIDEKRIMLVHGAPRDPDFYVYPDKGLDNAGISKVGVDICLLGHTHYPFSACVGGVLVANPGSVGQSRRYGGVAEWAMLDVAKKSVTPQYTEYDVQPVIEDCLAYDSEIPYLRDVLKRG